MPYTNGFRWSGSLRRHFQDHKDHVFVLGITTEAAYLAWADTFVGGPLPPGTLERLRPDGDRVRYNPRTDEFGVLDTRLNQIRTFWVLQGTKTNNLRYYHRQSGRTFP